MSTVQDKFYTHVGFLTLRCLELEHAVEALVAENEELKKNQNHTEEGASVPHEG